MARRFHLVCVVLMSLALSAAGCGSDRAPSTGSTSTTSSAASATPTLQKATGSLTVFAAASLTESFGDVQVTLKASDPDLSVVFSFGGSGALVTQVQQGAPVDVIATADTAAMKRLTDAGLVEAPITFARNKLEILVAPGNPLGIAGLADLARPGIKLVVGDESVPVGRFAAQALQAAGVTVNPVSKEADVKAVVAKVTLGEADAAIVYVTDVDAAGAKAEGVAIPDSRNVIADYPIAIVRATGNRAAAVAFVEEIVAGPGQGFLRARGFLPAR